MAISVFLMYFSIRKNELINRKILFNDLIKERRKVLIHMDDIKHPRDAGMLFFDFYDYLSICFFNKVINRELFSCYFTKRFGKVYDSFMTFPFFKDDNQRYASFPYLVKLLNYYGFSCRKKGYESYKKEIKN